MKWTFLAVTGAILGSLLALVVMYTIAVVLELMGIPLQSISWREPKMYFLMVWIVVALIGAGTALKMGRAGGRSHRW